jgi:tetratricopeptide (TPR) repeat protein
VSALDAPGPAPVQQRRARRWYRSAWLALLALALAGLLGGGLYLFWRAAPEPPEVDTDGVDPAIAAAIDEARQAVRRAPRSAEAWGRLGTILVVHEFRPPGIFCLAQAERLDPGEVRWPYFQALASLRAAEPEEALPKLERAVALCGDAFDAPRVRLAELLLSLDRLDEAEQHFRRLLEQNPRHPRAQLGLARLYHQRGDPRASLRYLVLPQTDARTRKAACQLLAEIQHRLGNESAAEEARQRAARLPEDPFWPDALNEEATALRTGRNAALLRARKLVKEGRTLEAVALLQNTVRDYRDADDAWLQLGQAFLGLKDPQAAEQALRRATELAPRSHINVYYLGAALIVRGDRPAALACFRKAVQLKPDFGPAHHNLGNCLVAAGDPAGAIDAYRTAVRCEPNLFEAHVALAALLTKKGQHAEALVHAQHALRLRPGDAKAQQLKERVQRGLNPGGKPGA